jgi:hypothetical protein
MFNVNKTSISCIILTAISVVTFAACLMIALGAIPTLSTNIANRVPSEGAYMDGAIIVFLFAILYVLTFITGSVSIALSTVSACLIKKRQESLIMFIINLVIVFVTLGAIILSFILV